MNFAKGILECRKQTYKHLKTLLKPIPLETLTRIELRPGQVIKATLLDANHCPGSCMFLIEEIGNVTRQEAVLYTGDVRPEAWWIQALVRQPQMIQYAAASNLQRLDQIYLDTTFMVSSFPQIEFPSKAQGTAELLRKLSAYPKSTTFYFHAWTFGYEGILGLLS